VAWEQQCPAIGPAPGRGTIDASRELEANQPDLMIWLMIWLTICLCIFTGLRGSRE
jgi:hypothetical protein